MTRHPEPQVWDALDTLSESTRRELLEHAGSCTPCRARLAADDPARLFSLLACRPLPPSALDELTRRVDRALDARPGAARTRPLVTAAAAAILLALLFVGYLSILPTDSPAPDVAPVAAIDVQQMLDHRAPLPGVELISSPGTAQVVDFSIGETQVVMIFDEELGI